MTKKNVRDVTRGKGARCNQKGKNDNPSLKGLCFVELKKKRRDDYRDILLNVKKGFGAKERE